MNRFSNSVAGLVLIELLIAVTVAVLILGAILMVYASALNTVASQNRWRVKSLPAAEALDSLVRDMSCAVLPSGGTGPVFTAAFSADEKEKEKFKMCFYRACPSGTSNAWHYAISRVCYALRDAGQAGEFVLVRESAPFRVPSDLPADREEWTGLKKMEIAFYDGAKWTNQWDLQKGSNSVPRAAHIKLFTGSVGQPRLETEVFVNTGRRITAPPTQ